MLYDFQISQFFTEAIQKNDIQECEKILKYNNKLILMNLTLTEEYLNTLITVLKQNPDIQELNLSGCSIGSNHLSLLLPQIKNLSKLESLNLTDNQLSHEDCLSLFSVLEEKNITALRLGGNATSNQTIISAMKLKTLKSLVINSLESTHNDHQAALQSILDNKLLEAISFPWASIEETKIIDRKCKFNELQKKTFAALEKGDVSGALAAVETQMQAGLLLNPVNKNSKENILTKAIECKQSEFVANILEHYSNNLSEEILSGALEVAAQKQQYDIATKLCKELELCKKLKNYVTAETLEETLKREMGQVKQENALLKETVNTLVDKVNQLSRIIGKMQRAQAELTTQVGDIVVSPIPTDDNQGDNLLNGPRFFS